MQYFLNAISSSKKMCVPVCQMMQLKEEGLQKINHIRDATFQHFISELKNILVKRKPSFPGVKWLENA